MVKKGFFCIFGSKFIPHDPKNPRQSIYIYKLGPIINKKKHLTLKPEGHGMGVNNYSLSCSLLCFSIFNQILTSFWKCSIKNLKTNKNLTEKYKFYYFSNLIDTFKIHTRFYNFALYFVLNTTFLNEIFYVFLHFMLKLFTFI